MNPTPTAGTGRSIINPKLSHCQVTKGTRMLDPQPHSWEKNIQSDSQPHCRYRQGYNQAKTHSLSSEQGLQHARSSTTFVRKNKIQNETQPHCRDRQGYNQAKTQLIVKWARGPTCSILTHIHEKKSFKMNLNPTARTGRGITKPKFTHSQVNKGSNMLDPHPHSCKKKFNIYPNPTTGTGSGITKPKFTHSQVNKGPSMMDPHPHSWKKQFQNLIQPHCWYRQGYNQAKSQLIVKWARGPTCWILTQSDGNLFFQNLFQIHCRYQ
jgi:hypothetical protein